ncbi:MAG: hypothetical protein RL033_961 [Pseudomonadota bacterium]
MCPARLISFRHGVSRWSRWSLLLVGCSATADPAPRTLPPPFSGTGGAPAATGVAGSSTAPGVDGAAAGAGGAPLQGSGGAEASGAAGASSNPASNGPGTGGSPARADGYAPVGPLSALCPAGSAFCEDFEDDALDAAPQSPWQDASNGATARVNASRAFGGGRALRVTVPSGPPPHRGYVALQQSSYAAANREMYGRVMVWLDATPTPPSAGSSLHWTLLQGEGRAATNNNNAIYRFGGDRQSGAGLMTNYETTPDGNPPVRSDCYQHSASTMPVQRWACFEWHFSQANDELQYWLDGSELADLHVIERGQGCRYEEPPLDGEWLAPPVFQTLYMGWEQYQAASNDVNIWLDTVVLSTTRVGCPAAE